MKTFWRTEPLTPHEAELVSAVAEAHYRSSFRENPSSLAVSCAAQGSGDLLKSFTAGLSALGGPHGPILETYDWLKQPGVPSHQVWIRSQERSDWRVPGWGSSFVKDGIDPIWKPVATMIELNFEQMSERIQSTTDALHAIGKTIYPNPSAFTAAAAIILGMPRVMSPYLIVIGRLAAWAEIVVNETKGI